MTDFSSETLSASFLDCESGKLFCIQSHPRKSNQHSVLLVPPFAEEMNSCRRFFKLIRRQLCKRGFTVIQPDLYGTGDSEGVFDDASWHQWTTDLAQLTQTVCLEKNNKLSMISVRSGCLLTQDLLMSTEGLSGEAALENLIYIQPEFSGYDVINKLLRVQVASDRLSRKTSETTGGLWLEFESGKNVHAAGYEIGHELAMQMRECRLVVHEPPSAINRAWIEMTPDARTEKYTDLWNVHSISSKPFWQMHDIEPANETVLSVAELVNV